MYHDTKICTSSGWGIYSVDGVTASKSINATILKLVKIQKQSHDRFTANDPKFLSNTLIQGKNVIEFYTRFKPYVTSHQIITGQALHIQAS